jgi:sulfite exporter TauE/SafE
MDISVATPVAAAAAGLATSLHCAGMCGPLACAVKADPLRYHASRFVAYSLAGALCGGLGQSVVALFKSAPLRIAPWAMVLVLLGLALGLEKKLPQPRWIARLMLRARLQQNLGFLTPLLPCGPLWLMLGVAAVSASALRGALLLGCFVAGTIPLYALLQSSWLKAQGRLSPLWLIRAQRALAMVAAALLVWRASLPSHASCH